jgi:hypothetical protein
MDASNIEKSARQFALLMGLPGDPLALELGRRLLKLNQRSSARRRRVKDELWGVLADMDVIGRVKVA